MEVIVRIKDIFKQELILYGSMYFKKLNDVINIIIEDYA